MQLRVNYFSDCVAVVQNCALVLIVSVNTLSFFPKKKSQGVS